MNSQEFAAKVRSKYPGSYDDLDDNTLTQNILTKYPQYKDMVDEGPGMLKSAALGAMSGIPGAETAVSGIESALTPKTYAEAHQGLETAKDQAWDTHPIAYGTGKGAGIVGTALAAPVTEGVGGAMALGAGIGALSGSDTAATPSDIPLSAAKGVGTGAVLGAAGHGVGKAIEAIPGATKGVLASLGSQTTKQDIEDYLNNPEAIRSALTKSQIGEKAADLTSDLGTAASHLSGEARGMLNPANSPLSAKGLKDIAMETVQKYMTEGNPATAADETSVKAIVDQYQKLAAIADGNGGSIPETTLRSMIDRLQAATKDSTYGNPEASASQQALKEFGGKLNDALRNANPDYAAGMAPSAELAKLSSDAKTSLSLKPNDEGVLSPTDATTTKLGNVLKEGKPQAADMMDRIKNATGQDLRDMLRKAQTKENFQAPDAGGALKTLMAGLGFGAGKFSGVPFGGIGGAAIGRYGAESMPGGNIAKGILDLYMSKTSSPIAQGISAAVKKFGPVLVNAAKVGGNELAATHFVLATSNPEYQALADHVQNGGQ